MQTHRGRRVVPFGRKRINVTQASQVAQFKPGSAVRIAYLLARTDDPSGLEACGIEFRPQGDTGNKLVAPDTDDNAERIPPPLSMVVPPETRRAEEYPGLLNDVSVGPGTDHAAMDIVITVIEGAVPFNLDLYFFAYADRC